MKKVFVLILVCLSFTLSAQAQYGNDEILYNKNGFKISVAFKFSKNSCENNGKPNRYRYTITGTSALYNQYLNWSIDYLDCNGNQYEWRNSLDLNGLIAGTIESLDYIFTGVKQSAAYKNSVSLSDESAKVLKPSLKTTLPKGIKGKTNINLGDTTELYVDGGVLGIGANWVWYSDTGSTKIGEGRSINVFPKKNITYYLRAEGTKLLSKFFEHSIAVNKESIAPEGISGSAEVYRNEKDTLVVNGGYLGENAEWVWYNNECGGIAVARGKRIIIGLKKSTTLYVRAEAPTNKTTCFSLTINVIKRQRTEDEKRVTRERNSQLAQIFMNILQSFFIR